MDDADTEADKVGYGCPPREYQFKPGQSGNPNGRPKGAKSLKGHMTELMDQKIAISDPSGTRRITRKHAVAMRVVEKAMRGDPKSIQLLMALDSQAEADNAKTETDLSPSELQLLDELLASQNGDDPDE